MSAKSQSFTMTLSLFRCHYVQEAQMEQYNIDFSEAEDLSILPNQSLVSRPPAMVTTSPKGDMVVLLEIQKDLDDYSEKQFLIVLYPYIANAKMMDDSTLQLLDGTYTTFWEIDGVEHVTHLVCCWISVFQSNFRLFSE